MARPFGKMWCLTSKYSRLMPRCKKLCENRYAVANVVGFMTIHTFHGNNTRHNVNGNLNQRPKTRKPIISHHVRATEDEHVCITYATAEEYRFHSLNGALSNCQHLTEVPLQSDIVYASCFKVENSDLLRSHSEGYIYFFREGALSFWNIKDEEIQSVMELVRPYQIKPYSQNLVVHENEKIDYSFSPEETKFHKNHFQLCQSADIERLSMEMYAFSNALVASVKLAHWEHSLDMLIDSIQTLPSELMTGLQPSYRSSKSILKKIGQVFQLRHQVNLQYNLLQVPDEYWDHEELEQLFVATTQYLSIPKRVQIMNEKLSYCAHMVEMVKSHLAEQKSMRIELLIVLLILIEVIFEVIHYFVAPYFTRNDESSCSRDT